MELKWRESREQRINVTPQIALAWLTSHNKFNRPLRKSVVAMYVRDMLAGRFLKNGEPITFDWNGQLINGQHRLEAIFQSGVTLEFLIITGLDPTVRMTVDIQIKRTVRDGFELGGFGNLLGSGSVLPNTAAGMWSRIKLGIVNNKGKDTRSEVIEFARKNPEGGIFALDTFGQHPTVRGVFGAGVLAAVARASYHYMDDSFRVKLVQFVDVLCTGLQKGKHDETIIRFRNALTGISASGINSNAQHEIYGKTAACIQSYMRGENLRRFYCPSEEPFPLPESSATRAPSTPRLNRVVSGRGKPNGRVAGDDQVAENVLTTTI